MVEALEVSSVLAALLSLGALHMSSSKPKKKRQFTSALLCMHASSLEGFFACAAHKELVDVVAVQSHTIRHQ